jgi:hypothetical protein
MNKRKPKLKDPVFAAIERPLTERVDTIYTLADSLDTYQSLSPSSRALVQHVDLTKLKVLHSIYRRAGEIFMHDETPNFPELRYGGYYVISYKNSQITLTKYKNLENAVKSNPEFYNPEQTKKEIIREVIVDSRLSKMAKITKQNDNIGTGGHYSDTTERIDY